MKDQPSGRQKSSPPSLHFIGFFRIHAFLPLRAMVVAKIINIIIVITDGELQLEMTIYYIDEALR